MQRRREKGSTKRRTHDTVGVEKTPLKGGTLFVDYHHLTPKERALIAQLWNNGISMRQLARRLQRSPGTICREIKRNRSGQKYLSVPAQALYFERRMKCHRKRLYQDFRLADYISEKLELAWSPEQIAGRIRLDYPDDRNMRISHSSIYRWLRSDLLPRSVQLTMKLRHYGRQYGERRGYKAGAREIRERSKEALRRKRLGDWEADTIIFKKTRQTYLLNVTDRKSRYCCLAALRNARREAVMRGFEFFFESGKLPLCTVTSDRGAEFNCHHEFESRFEALYYYTRPASPWQKPTVENTNGLIRQFFPRGIDFAELTEEAVAFVMELLNNRPRKCLGWKTPAEVISS